MTVLESEFIGGPSDGEKRIIDTRVGICLWPYEPKPVRLYVEEGDLICHSPKPDVAVYRRRQDNNFYFEGDELQ